MSLNETYLNKILDATDIAGPIENGHLALKNVVSLLLSDGDIQTKREIEPVTNFQSTGKEIEVTFTSDYNDVDGLSAAYVTSEGQINGDALMADFTRTGFGRSVTSDASSPAGHCVCVSDSQDAYVYNMLVSVVKALLYRSSKEEGKLGTEFGTLAGFRVARHQYSSSHVGVYGPDGPDTTFVSYCGPPTNTTSEYGLVMVGSTNYERISEFAHFPADTGAQMKFYADHLGGRDVTSGAFPATDKLNIEFDIPGVESDVGIMPYCGFNKRVEVEWALATVDYTNPYRMYDWVKAYVKANRLEKAFAAAHELITSLLLHPTWSSAEATTWDNTVLRVTLPKMKFGRAKFPQLLQGDPVKAVNYRTVVTCTTADDFQKDLIRGAIVNYATWLGIYSLTIHTADAMGPNWRQAFNRGYYEPGTWGCYGMRTKMLSYLTGIDTISYEHAACGLYYDVSKMEHIKKEIKHKKHETPHPVLYDYIYAPVSGSLLLGAIRDVGPRISHLTSHYVVKCPESNNPRYEFSEALAFAQLQRFYGYDTTFFDACGKEVRPWANSSEWVLESASLYRDCHKMPYFTVSDLSERPNSADQNLPRLQRIRRGMTFELLIKRPIIQQTKYGSRKKTAPTYTPLRSLVPITYKVRSAYTGQLISCPEVTVFPSLGDRDFRLAPDTSQPLRPVTTTSLGLEKEEPTSYMPSSSVLDVSMDSPSTSQVHSDTLPVHTAPEPAVTSADGSEHRGSAATKTGQQTYVPTPPDVWQGLEKPTDANRRTWGRAKFGPDGSELNLQSPLK